MAKQYRATIVIGGHRGRHPLVARSLAVDHSVPAHGPPIQLPLVGTANVCVPSANKWDVIDFASNPSYIWTKGLWICLAYCLLYNPVSGRFERASLAHVGQPDHALIRDPSGLVAGMPQTAKRWMVVCVRDSLLTHPATGPKYLSDIERLGTAIVPSDQLVIYRRKDEGQKFGVNYRGEFGEL